MTRSDLHPQIDNTIFANLVGAIAAGKHADLMHVLVNWALGADDLVSTITGNSQVVPFSQAGAYLLDANLRQYVVNAISQAKSDILGGVGPAYDTLQELAALEISDQSAIAAILVRLGTLEAAAGTYLKPDGSVALTAPQVGIPGTASNHLATVGQLEAGGPTFGVSASVTVAQVSTTGVLLGTTRTAEAGQPTKVFIPSECYVSLRSKGAGTLTTAGVLSIGTNAPDYNNISPLVPLANATTLGLNVQQVLNSQSVPAGTSIYYKVITAQIGTAATSCDLFLRGFYHVLPS